MKEIKVSLDMIENARIKSTEMGKLHNSILKGGGNLAGFIGEQIALECLGGEWHNTYSYDIILPDGKKVDVKTKQTSVKPLPEYDCSIAKFNTKQECDMYAFVRVKNDLTIGWYLGSIDKKEYFKKAIFMKKGYVDPSNNFTVRADCYNMKIKELDNSN
jgi:hypothetical protein|tara:strand:+ start:89 stop:565 length:477 start_codon:yes stop_codon:yes gene_type:complete